jgi:hypothetical protein
VSVTLFLWLVCQPNLYSFVSFFSHSSLSIFTLFHTIFSTKLLYNQITNHGDSTDIIPALCNFVNYDKNRRVILEIEGILLTNLMQKLLLGNRRYIINKFKIFVHLWKKS